MRASTPHNQAERLQTLSAFGVLDTERETDFDEIVELASVICEAPISLVSLVDSARQWFKAKVGFDLDQTPIDLSICSHAILQDDLLEIRDTRQDERTANNPLVTGPENVRFYAGMQLTASNGHNIGTLCVLDNKPRTLNAFQKRTLVILARQVMRLFEHKQALRDQEILRSEMDHRVKNSLQATSSIVRIYTRSIQDNAAVEALQAIQRRIDAMSVLHEQLQHSSRLALVDLQAYLSGVVDLLNETIPDNITVNCEAAQIYLPSSKATNLGLVTSEFVANAVKHGYPDGRIGEINIALKKDTAGHIELECRDDGVGSSLTPTQPSRIEGIGSNLVAAAASSLDGTLHTELNHTGCVLSLTFPAD